VCNNPERLKTIVPLVIILRKARLSDVSEENAASILRVKHLPEPKIHPEDEDSMIPETSEQTIQ
jgi:hypothetical protein